MRKRIRVLGILIMIFVMCLCGCQKDSQSGAKYKEIDYTQIDYKNEKASYAERKKEIVVIAEETIAEEVRLTALWYMRSQDEVKVTIEILSSDKQERAGQLQELRTEIMAGKGPDLYLLETQNEAVFETDRKEPLFGNVNKAIESGFFDDLTEYMKEDEFWKNNSLSEVFLKPGQMKEEQYVLPLSCTYYVLVGMADEEIELGDSIGEWMDTIRFSGNQALKEDCTIMYFQAARMMQPAIDYNEKQVVFEKEKWVSWILEDVIPYREEVWSMEHTAEEQYYLWQVLQVVNEIEMTNARYHVCESVPGLKGEYKASIESWGAVGRSSEYKQNAYDFLMLFLNNYVANANQELEGGMLRYPGVDEWPCWLRGLQATSVRW